MHLHRQQSKDSKYFFMINVILTNTGIFQLTFAGPVRTQTMVIWFTWLWAHMFPVYSLSHRNTHTTQKVYKIKTSLLLRGRDGDTMMSSESSESAAAAPPDSAVQLSSVWTVGDTHTHTSD